MHVGEATVRFLSPLPAVKEVRPARRFFETPIHRVLGVHYRLPARAEPLGVAIVL